MFNRPTHLPQKILCQRCKLRALHPHARAYLGRAGVFPISIKVVLSV